MVRPDDEADEADRHHGVRHAEIAEDGLARERRDDLAGDAEARQDQDIDLGVAEEPEQMLEQDRIAAALGIEERGAEVAVGQQHGDRARQHRQRQQQQERGHQHRPYEQRHLVQRHAGRAHVEDGGDEVYGAQDRRCARQVDREDRHVDRRSGLAGRGAQRRVDRPAAADEENHDQPVRRDQHIEEVVIAAKNVVARRRELGAKDNRQGPADDAEQHRVHEVHGADVLVVGRIHIAPPTGRMIFVMAVCRHTFAHDLLPRPLT